MQLCMDTISKVEVMWIFLTDSRRLILVTLFRWYKIQMAQQEITPFVKAVTLSDFVATLLLSTKRVKVKLHDDTQNTPYAFLWQHFS